MFYFLRSSLAAFFCFVCSLSLTAKMRTQATQSSYSVEKLFSPCHPRLSPGPPSAAPTYLRTSGSAPSSHGLLETTRRHLDHAPKKLVDDPNLVTATQVSSALTPLAPQILHREAPRNPADPHSAPQHLVSPPHAATARLGTLLAAQPEQGRCFRSNARPPLSLRK